MHEAGLMEEALRAAEQAAREAGAERIHRLRLRIGRLSGVEPEALRLAFEALRPGTIAEHAHLDLEIAPVLCRCRRCHVEFAPEDFVFLCPRCGIPSAEVLRGLELELLAVEAS
ncbi:MAG: hydrogenase maturation nickel metallochaperone HypA [Gemmatales bacterium]|nr:hydrogenase maturation nickel metallochaperone HypA [Gemmatales bacterium]MDW8386363.1 hydrogenase maturation nickel metallochaperone HypA [Gemmatales bacterium]